jgi:hypothetical protein
MIFFSLILFLLLPWPFPPHPFPTTEIPESWDPGLNPFHGIEDRDTAQFTLILNLIHSGAYKVEGTVIHTSGPQTDTIKSDFLLSARMDSIFVDVYFYNDGKSYLAQKAIYRMGGTPLSFTEKKPTGEISGLYYLESKNSWVEYGDSMRLKVRKLYDNFGRLAEIRSYGFSGDSTNMSVYQYDKTGGWRVLQYGERWNSGHLIRGVNELGSMLVHRVDSTHRTIEDIQFSSSGKDSTPDSYYIRVYDEHWREATRYEVVDEKKELLDENKYEYDSYGHAVTHISYYHGDESSHEEWSYDKSGRQVRHQYRYGPEQTYMVDTSVYDAKGNLAESHGPSWTLKNKIYYK